MKGGNGSSKNIIGFFGLFEIRMPIGYESNQVAAWSRYLQDAKHSACKDRLVDLERIDVPPNLYPFTTEHKEGDGHSLWEYSVLF